MTAHKEQTHCQCGRLFPKRRRNPKTNLCRPCNARIAIEAGRSKDHPRPGRRGITPAMQAKIIELLRANPLPVVKRDTGWSYKTLCRIAEVCL